MILKGLMVTVSDEKTGVSQVTGKEWKTKDITFTVEHSTVDGRTYSDSFVGSYFGDKSVEELRAFIGQPVKLDFECWFQTELYNGRWYQRCRITNISQAI